MALSKEQFFSAMEQQGLALTFDDVSLMTRLSDVAAVDVDLSTQLTSDLRMPLPVMSAAMDTVTGSATAIAITKEGGVGVIPASYSPEQQRREVRAVKKELNGLIEGPICAKKDETLADLLELCDKKNYKFRSFPVIDDEGRFEGLLTQRDFDFCPDKSITVEEAMTHGKDVITGLGSMSVNEVYNLMREHKKKTLPLLDDEGRMAGLYVLSDVLRIIEGNPLQYNLDSSGRLLSAAAITTDEEGIERVRYMGGYLDVAFIDTFRGDGRFARETLAKLLDVINGEFPHMKAVIGNITDPASAEVLAQMGAHAVKVGQGIGSICVSTQKLGVGRPQLTAVYECSRALEPYGVPAIADGGMRSSADIAAALAAGASSVMLGRMLAATKEAPVPLVEDRAGGPVKLYRGMGSVSAMRDSAAARKRYGAEGRKVVVSHGVESYLPYQGPIADILQLIVASLRETLEVTGAKDLKAFRDLARFERRTNNGKVEAGAHDVQVIA